MKRACLLIVLAGLMVNPARANIRAPHKVDGFFSGNLESPPVSAAVRLVGEDLRFYFPDFTSGLAEEKALVGITVQYEIFNSSSVEVEVPVHFLAVDILDPAASVDDRPLSVELIPDPAEKSEFLWRLARHRSNFMGSFHEEFLGKMRRAAGLTDAPDAEWLSALEEKDLSGIDPGEIFPVGRWRSEAADFKSAGMLLPLRPGTSRLRISYSQRMYVEERGYGYSSGWPRKGFSGVDYLLYPATSWPLDSSFKLVVSVEIPEIQAKSLLGKRRLKPKFRSNLPFLDGGSKQEHVLHLRAEASDFPADILSILVWFDPKAHRYLSE